MFLTILGLLFVGPSSGTRKIFREIDTNEDKAISKAELAGWFNFKDIEYLKQNAKEHFTMFDKNRDQMVSWEEYAAIAFGTTHVDTCNDLYKDKRSKDFDKLGAQVQDAIKTAIRRWKAAGGYTMNQEEFTAFTYPELFQHMRNVVVAEAYQMYDKNSDGKVSAEELLESKFGLTSEQMTEFYKGKLDMEKSPNILGLKDRNNNRIFEKKELSFWLMENRRLMRKEEAEKIFRDMDSDKNTRISKPEFEENSHMIKYSSIGRFINGRDEL